MASDELSQKRLAMDTRQVGVGNYSNNVHANTTWPTASSIGTSVVIAEVASRPTFEIVQ